MNFLVRVLFVVALSFVAGCSQSAKESDTATAGSENNAASATNNVTALCFRASDKSPIQVSFNTAEDKRYVTLSDEQFSFTNTVADPEDGVVKNVLQHRSDSDRTLFLGLWNSSAPETNGWSEGDGMIMVWNSGTPSEASPDESFACPSLFEQASFYFSVVNPQAGQEATTDQANASTEKKKTNQELCYERVEAAKDECAIAGNPGYCLQERYPWEYSAVVTSKCEFMKD